MLNDPEIIYPSARLGRVRFPCALAHVQFRTILAALVVVSTLTGCEDVEIDIDNGLTRIKSQGWYTTHPKQRRWRIAECWKTPRLSGSWRFQNAWAADCNNAMDAADEEYIQSVPDDLSTSTGEVLAQAYNACQTETTPFSQGAMPRPRHKNIVCQKVTAEIANHMHELLLCKALGCEEKVPDRIWNTWLNLEDQIAALSEIETPEKRPLVQVFRVIRTSFLAKVGYFVWAALLALTILNWLYLRWLRFVVIGLPVIFLLCMYIGFTMPNGLAIPRSSLFHILGGGAPIVAVGLAMGLIWNRLADDIGAWPTSFKIAWLEKRYPRTSLRQGPLEDVRQNYYRYNNHNAYVKQLEGILEDHNLLKW